MKKISVALCFLLAVIVSFTSFTAINANALQINNDYSNPSSSNSKILSSADVLEKVYDQTVTDGEREYLNATSDVTFSYENIISTAYVSRVYENDKLEIFARAYEYTATNGQKVVYEPVSVALNGDEKNLEIVDGMYYACFEGVTLTEADTAKVRFSREFVINKDSVNAIANKARIDAQDAIEYIREQDELYNQNHAVWEQEKKNYEDYLQACAQYELDTIAYNDYMREYKLWSDKKSEYDNYLVELADYEKKTEAYNKYLVEMDAYNKQLAEFKAYPALKAEYDKKYPVYLEYITKKTAADKHLAAMHLIATQMTSLNRSIYSAVLGDVIDSVLERKDDFVDILWADAKAIDLAADSTVIFRQHIRNYFAITSDTEKYAYYTANYASIASSCEDLFRALDRLYRSGNVAAAISVYENGSKEEKLIILIAQLFILANALKDTPVVNFYNEELSEDTWTIGHKKGAKFRTAIQILGQKWFEDDNNAKPVDGGYPTVVVVEPIKPTEVKEPVLPAVVQKPTAPALVTNPGDAPTEVKQPVLPEVVSAPGVEPQPYQPTTLIANLVNNYNNGAFPERQPLTEDFAFVSDVFVDKKIIGSTDVSVSFHDEEDTKILYVATVDKGTYAEYVGEIPVKAEDVSATYLFDYWVDEFGNKVDLTNIQTDVNVYPHFAPTLKKYAVTWRIEGVDDVRMVEYGTQPEDFVYDGVPQKADDGNYKFRFSHWNKEILPVTGDVTYTARFEKSCLVTWVVEDVRHVVPVFKGENAADYEYQGATKADSGSYYYVFTGWNKTPGVVTSNVEYRARFKAHYLVPYESGGGATVSVDENYYTIDCQASFTNKIDIANIVTRALRSDSSAVGRGIKILMNKFELVLSYKNVLDISDGGFTVVEVYNAERDTYSFEYKVSILDENGNEPDFVITTNAKIISGPYDEIHSTLYSLDEDEQFGDPVRYAIDDVYISFIATIGTGYRLVPKYSVNVVKSDIVSITVNKTEVDSNEWVEVQFGEIPPGVLFDGYYVVDSKGNELEIIDGKFRVSHDDVTVGVNCSYIDYTVKFIADGKIIFSSIYRYGDEVIPPANPVKPNDEIYSYKFVGWDKTVTAVTGDVEYNAVYEAELLPPPVEPPIAQKEGISTLRLALYIVIGVGVVLVVGVPILIILLVRRAKKRRNK